MKPRSDLIRNIGFALAMLPPLAWLAANAQAGAAAPAAEPPVPLLWKVSDADNAIWLLGSFHLLRPDDYPLSKDVDAAFADAGSLLFEMSPEEMNSPALPALMLQAGQRSDGRRLQDDLDPAIWAALQDYANKNAMPLDAFSGYEPWFVGLSIGILELRKQGMDPRLGLDEHFMAAAAAAHKPAHGLETGREQIALLDGMSAEEQKQFLAETLDEASKGSQESARLHAAWRAGDADTLLNDMAAEMKRDYPRLYRRVDVDRNDAWVPKLARLLDDAKSGDVLVVVGALHLLGPDGVVEKLRAKGYRVERICSACAAPATRKETK